MRWISRYAHRCKSVKVYKNVKGLFKWLISSHNGPIGRQSIIVFAVIHFMSLTNQINLRHI